MAKQKAKVKKLKPAQTLAPSPKPLFELDQAVGQFMQYWGFKNIHGRIWNAIEFFKNLPYSFQFISVFSETPPIL